MTPTSQPHLAAAMILAAMAMVGLIDNFVTTIAETAGLWQFHVIRTTMALGLLSLLAGVFGWRLRPYRWRPVIARSAILSVALMIYFAGLALMPIAQAVAGLFTAPIFVLAVSGLVLRRPPGGARIVAALVRFLGVAMVLRPDADAGWLVVLPLVSGLFYALAQIATREWCATEPPLALLWGFFAAMGLWGLAGLCVLTAFPQAAPEGAAGFMLRRWGDMAPEAWAWTAAQAVVSLAAVGLIIRAYQIAEAATVTVYEYALMAFAAFWGWLLLGHGVDGWTMAGIAAITLSGVIMSYGARAGAKTGAGGVPPAPDADQAASARPSPKRS